MCSPKPRAAILNYKYIYIYVVLKINNTLDQQFWTVLWLGM